MYGAGRFTYTLQPERHRGGPRAAGCDHAQQQSPGWFDVPNWDAASRTKVGQAPIQLAATIPDTKGMFGAGAQVDPVRHVVGAATGWGGNPEKTPCT